MGVMACAPAVLAQFDACPPSYLRHASPQWSTDPIRYFHHGATHGSGYGAESYNLAAGALTASAWGTGQFGGFANVITVDDMKVIGVTPGTPLSFIATLEVVAYSTWYDGFLAGGGFSASLQKGDSPPSSVSYNSPRCCPGPDWSYFHASFVIPVTVEGLAGETFRITCSVEAWTAAWGEANASASLRFTGLPPGSSVISCQGYRLDIPTEARRTSWGDLKARYR